MSTPYIIDDRETPRFRVHRSTMVDADVLAAERERIFDRCWLYVGHETELKQPNDYIARDVMGRPVIFCRDADGTINVFLNSCTHRGTLLCRERSGNSRFMKCFYHAWSFDTSGALVALPDEEGYGPDFDRDNLGLARPAHLDSYRGFVFVSFASDVVGLREYLAGAADYIDLVCDQAPDGLELLRGSHEYSMAANWKLLIENSMDAYHAGSTHQRYFAMVESAWDDLDDDIVRPTVYASKSAVQYGANLDNGHACGASVAIERGSGGMGRPLPDDAARAEWDAHRERLEAEHGLRRVARMYGSRNLLVFPNLMLLDLVGTVLVRKIEPIRPDYSEVTAWELAPTHESATLRELRLSNFLTFWGPGGLATPDDVEALETCQRGFGTLKELPWSDISRGMRREVPMRSDEYHMRTFWREWNRRMTGVDLPPEPHEVPVEIRDDTGVLESSPT